MTVALAAILRVLLIPAALYLMTLYRVRQNRKEDAKLPVEKAVIIRQPKIYCWAGCMAILLLAAIHAVLVCFAIGNERVFSILFSILELFVALTLYSFLQWKLVLFRNEDFFVLTDLYGKTFTIH